MVSNLSCVAKGSFIELFSFIVLILHFVYVFWWEKSFLLLQKLDDFTLYINAGKHITNLVTQRPFSWSPFISIIHNSQLFVIPVLGDLTIFFGSSRLQAWTWFTYIYVRKALAGLKQKINTQNRPDFLSCSCSNTQKHIWYLGILVNEDI